MTVSSPAPVSNSRRTLGLMLLLTALGAVLVLTAVARTWAEGVVNGTGGGRLEISVTGSTVSGLPGGLALVALAAAVAVFAVRGVGRPVVGGLLLLAGLGAAGASAAGSGDSTALDGAAAQKLALAGVHAGQVGHTAWPWVALVGSLLLVAAGLLAVRYGRGWPAMGSRYEAPTRKTPARNPATGATGTPSDLWQALDRGEDPTA